MDVRDLPVEAPSHEALAHQFNTMHLGFDAASTVVSAPASPERTPEVSRCIDRSDVLIFGYLVEQLRQHRRITDVVGRDLDGPNFQCFLVDPDMYLAPDASFGAAMLARIPFAF